MPADGVGFTYVEARSAEILEDGAIRIVGSSYYPAVEDRADGDENVTAVVKPHVYNGKNTWSLVEIHAREKPMPEPDDCEGDDGC